MKSQLLVRRAARTDAETIAAFNVAMALETERKQLDPATVRRGVSALFDRPEYGFYVVAAGDGDVLGCLMITYEWSDWRAALFWWIQSVYVRPDSRRTGVFRKMYDFVQTQAAAQPNVCGLRLYVEKANLTAKSTYTALGLKEVDYHVYEIKLRSRTP